MYLVSNYNFAHEPLRFLASMRAGNQTRYLFHQTALKSGNQTKISIIEVLFNILNDYKLTWR
jgi:hypothetical protein